MTREVFSLVFLFLSLMGLLFYLRRREGRYLKKKTVETLSQSLREEIDKERQTNLEKKKKFEEALRKAGG